MAEAAQDDNMQDIEIEVSEPRGKDLIEKEISKLKGETAAGEVDVQVDEKPEEPPVEATEETKEDSDDKKDKYQNYSKDVQKRINTLVRRAKEAEEREAALANKLKQVEAQTSQTQSQYNTMQDGYYNEFKTRVETQLSLAKDSLKKAYQNNDPDQIIAAQELLSKATLDKERLTIATADRERRAQAPQEQPVPNPQPQVQQEQAPAPDPRAKAWAEKNSWFGNDEAMTYTAFSIHKKLIEEEGFDPNSDEYYAEIDQRIKNEFPHKFSGSEQTEESASSKPRVVQPVASVKRGGGNARKVVRLTPRQIQMAKNLGVPLDAYAKQVKE